MQRKRLTITRLAVVDRRQHKSHTSQSQALQRYQHCDRIIREYFKLPRLTKLKRQNKPDMHEIRQYGNTVSYCLTICVSLSLSVCLAACMPV